ncbi:MAG: DUF167 domain-containing protein [Candidatus Paceibacterota bacterium]|jgi:hypothetical protein
MYAKVSVRTGSKKEFVKQEGPDAYLIAVAAPPERGLANERVIELLREHIGGERLMLRIVSGHHSPHKIVSIEVGQ